MKRRMLFWLGIVACLGLGSTARAQVAAVTTPAGGTAVAAAPTQNLWSFLCLSPEQRARCRERWCNSGLGMMVSGMVDGPVGAMTGGLCKSKCSLPSPEDLAKPATSAEGAAAKIKQDELDAKARREAVRYLGTVDCHYWPEAEEALINALRGDRNECVRLEAALALNRGCCCTPKTIEALTISVTGSEKDGFPSEKSERVRCVAAEALAHCTATYMKIGPAETGDTVLPVPTPIKKVELTPKQYYDQAAQRTKDQAMEKARAVLAVSPISMAPKAPVQVSAGRPRGSEGVIGIVANAIASRNTAPEYVEAPLQPVAQTQPVVAQPVTSAQQQPQRQQQPQQPRVIPVQSIPSQPVSAPSYNNDPARVTPVSSSTPISMTAPQTGRVSVTGQTVRPVGARPAPRGLIPLLVNSFKQ